MCVPGPAVWTVEETLELIKNGSGNWRMASLACVILFISPWLNKQRETWRSSNLRLVQLDICGPNPREPVKFSRARLNCLTCSRHGGAGLGLLILINPTVAALVFRGHSPADSLSWCPQGFTSNHTHSESSRDSSPLTQHLSRCRFSSWYYNVSSMCHVCCRKSYDVKWNGWLWAENHSLGLGFFSPSES